MKQRLIFALLLSLTLSTFAQAPKTLKQVKNAVYTVHTYDADGNTLHTGNGFFVSGGEFISSYALFPECAKAEVIGSNGKTFAIISMNDEASDIPSTGCEKVRNSGAISATAIFICIV